ncbi:SEC10/PgrA surface exclusion domain-containing protein, partial [Lactobacillus amylovorus]
MSEKCGSLQDYKSASDQYESATDKLNEAQKNKDAADKALSEANEAVNTATSNQKEKQDAADGAKNGLTQAQKNKDAADKALNDANDGVKTTTATQKEKQTAVDEAQKSLTQAQKNKDVADKALSDASEAVKTATATQKEKQDAADEAQKSLIQAQNSKDAADKALSEANEAVNTATATQKEKQTAVDEAQDALTQAQKGKETADKALSEANEAVKTATATQKEKQDAADEAQDALTQAQKGKETADKALSEANEAVNTATATQKEKQNAIDEAQDALTQAQKGKETADKALSEANEAVNTATATQKEKQTAADEAQDALTQAQKAKDAADKALSDAQRAYNNDATLKDAQTAADKANSDLKNNTPSIDQEIKDNQGQLETIKDLDKNRIKISDIDRYKKAFKDYYDLVKQKKQLTEATDPDDIAFFKQNGLANKFISSDADKKIIISDVNNMTDDQIKELSLFEESILNGLRKQLGWSEYEITNGSLKMAKDVANQYIADKWGTTKDQKWHDVKGINAVAGENGLEQTDNKTHEQLYENATLNSYSYGSATTMDDLKKDVYNTILTMIFPDGNGYDAPGTTVSYEMAHARGLLGSEEGELTPILPDEFERLEECQALLKTLMPTQYSTPYVRVNENDPRNQQAVNEWRKSQDATKPVVILDGKYMTYDKFTDYINKNRSKFEKQVITSVGVSISNNPVPNAEVQSWIHLISVDKSNIKDATKFDSTHVKSYEEQENDINNSIKDLNDRLMALQREVDNTSTTLKSIEKLKHSEYKLDELSQAVTNAKTTLTQAQNAKDAADKALSEANEAVNTATATQKEKQTAVD